MISDFLFLIWFYEKAEYSVINIDFISAVDCCNVAWYNSVVHTAS